MSKLKGKVAVATANLQDCLCWLGKHAFDELVSIEDAQFDHGYAPPLEPPTRIKVWVSPGMSYISDEVWRKVTHGSPPSLPRLGNALCL